MTEIGKFNHLKVKKRDLDVYLDGGKLGDILLPNAEMPENCQIGDSLKVFVYSGVKGQLTATFTKPLAEVDDIAWLRAVSVNHTGGFLDWGLPKDLLVPFSEQRYPMEVGHHYLVKIFLDEHNRIAATTKFEHLIIEESFYFKEGEKVSAIIAERTDLGFKAIINNSHWGMLYTNELFQPLKKGQKVTAYIKQIRSDKKIDLILHQPGYGKVEELTDKILAVLKTQQDGYLAISDKSPPEQIYALFGVSKKAFKQAIGALFKKKLIDLDKNGIRLL
jgi:predicted RNA-binding protein (virulence factor B family)